MSCAAHDDALCAKAIQIADECMLAQLECHTVPFLRSSSATERRCFGLCNESGVEVGLLADAAPEIVSAFEWLRLRGLASLDKDDHGEFIALAA